MKRLRWLTVPLALAVVAAIVVSQFQFKSSFVGRVSIANAQIADTSPPSMDIRFEPSGTHVDSKGNLKIRLDFFPTPDSKSYASQHVEVTDTNSKEYLAGYQGKVDEKTGEPLDPADYQKWLDGLPKVWVTNPALCHFLTVKPDITVAQLNAIVLGLFPSSVTATIDDALIQTNSAHLLSPYMRDKSSTTLSKVAPTEDKVSLVDAVNARLAGFNVPADSKGGTVEPIQPQSIDVGPGATDRGSANANNYSFVEFGNKANASGTLDTMETWFATNGTGLVMGTFSGSSATWDDRDYETIGNVTAGSKQTFTGLNCDVETNDCLGSFYSSGGQERDTSGGSGYGYVLYENTFGQGSHTYALTGVTTRASSIYATGTEAATFAITNAPGTTVALGVLAVSSTYYAFGSAPSNPVADNETTQTLTETGGGACDIDIHGHNSTGGAGMSITSNAPGANQFRITAYKGGDNPTGLVITTSDQEFKDNLAASGHFHWDFKFEAGSSFTEPAQQTTTLTVTARAHS